MKSVSEVRVRYVDTDQMGVAYHSNFLIYFEVGRTDYFRQFGLTYKQLEKENVFMPVTESYCKHYTSAEYDDELRIITSLERISRLQIKFKYEVIRKNDEKLIADGYTIHVPVNADGKPCRIPDGFREVLNIQS